MSQADFAEFIEDNAADVVKPESARLLEIVNNFKATKSLAFKSAQNLINGETKLSYDETIESSGGKAGRSELPEQFEIGIRLFDGLAAYKLKARFRYRIEDREKKLLFSYQLMSPQLSERDAVMQVINAVEASPHVTFRGEAHGCRVTPGILPFALRASLRLFKIAPGDFVEPLDLMARLAALGSRRRASTSRAITGCSRRTIDCVNK